MDTIVILAAGLVGLAVVGAATVLAIGQHTDRRERRTSQLDRLADHLLGLVDDADPDWRLAIRVDPAGQAIKWIEDQAYELGLAQKKLAAIERELAWVAGKRKQDEPRSGRRDWPPFSRLYPDRPGYSLPPDKPDRHG